MKYIKSKGGYFYKAYKNEKKKRVSKEEFMKHKKPAKKTNKKYKMKGGISERYLNLVERLRFRNQTEKTNFLEYLDNHELLVNNANLANVNLASSDYKHKLLENNYSKIFQLLELSHHFLQTRAWLVWVLAQQGKDNEAKQQYRILLQLAPLNKKKHKLILSSGRKIS